jgi:hypothetical protein
MTNKSQGSLRVFVPVTGCFILVNILALALGGPLRAANIQAAVLLWGNLVLALATLLSLILFRRAIAHPSTFGFLRNTYSGLLIKLLICVVAVLAYAWRTGPDLNKPGVFGCVMLYFVYSFLEMRSLLRWNKARKNA